ncbi:monosaccharide ABC transporter substrate-binding protein (CUT2 family) [Branchiibius hedensis]|uniref:Monosaccharide ABC transporter substrate-binding protein, CUT2 family n=1 Tax=Branchiibius hedensis TaxID=672460 RepID=A0A2Y8ZUI2_9MICO|nr:substrate-binding domain-containing protein [Branchiibius hedensis]PWJ26774.1 monosaccharide ABC transporter substrate-binding protein (CUT2 family) [Branchiibius hedensis]SSA35585.1 monosaccharide ABC transporter substrate-binding protein, CUT2 family [Branchiibius hedensis]
MRKGALSAAVFAASGVMALAACGSSSSSSSPSATAGGGGTSAGGTTSATSSAAGASGTVDGKGAKVGIILPDRTTSNRWISTDPDALAARCKADNLDCDIQNANNSATTMATQADTMMNNGVKVLMLVNLDSASAAKIEQKAKSKGIITIDYDRLTLGGDASLYVSFDNVKVGELQGQTLVQCPQVKGKSSVNYVELNGAPTDNNATLFAQGYNSVLSKQPGWKKLADQSIANWDNTQAGITFTSMYQKNPDIQAVMVANDGMAGPVIADLAKQKKAGAVAVSGQDATVEGLQRIMQGTQCFTIYKPSVGEANPAVDAAAKFATGQLPTTTATVTDTETGRKVPAILATPIAITQANVALPINDGYTPKATTCANTFAELCTKFGVK